MTTTTPAVRLAGISKRFGAIDALAQVDLTIQPGESVALLGPNGAGKSTTIAILLGLTPPDSGQVVVGGQPPRHAVAAGRVGAMLQEGQLPEHATVRDLIELARAIYPDPMPIVDVLAMAGLADLADRRTDRLSGGQAQRVRFGFAVAGNPELLVLDEPTAGMDTTSRRDFWTAMRHRLAAGHTVLFATHDLSEADEFADRIVVVSTGQIVADGPVDQVKQAVSGRTVAFDLDDGPTRGLDELPGVRGVQIRGGRATLVSDDADATVSALIQSRGPVRGLDVSSASLADAVVTLTAATEDSS